MQKNSLTLASLILFPLTLQATVGHPPHHEIHHAPAAIPFASIEGGYTWNKLNGLNVSVLNELNIDSEKSKHGLTGRAAVGLFGRLAEPFLISGEIGWGYYGRTTLNPEASGGALQQQGAPDFDAIELKTSLNGFDILAGIIYYQSCYDIFLKAGAMVQNSVTSAEIDIAALTNDLLTGDIDVKSNNTEALPVIKLGASYHFNDNFFITGSWTHVFGYTKKVDVIIDPNAPLGQVNINLQNPTLNVAMVGLQFNYC